MALSATASQGLEFMRFATEGEILWVPSDPGDTLTRGDMVTCTAGEGVMDVAADSEVPYGVVVATVTSPANTVAFPLPAAFDPAAISSSASQTLVGIMPFISAGTPIFSATFAGQYDDTVAAYTAGNVYMQMTTGCAADDRPNGALLYVYEGPGIGEVNIVEDYDHTGGTVELQLNVHRKFATTLTTSSKFIVVAGEAAASKGVSPLGRMDIQDQNNLHAADGADDGNFVVYCSWERLGSQLKNLRLPVIHANALLASS